MSTLARFASLVSSSAIWFCRRRIACGRTRLHRGARVSNVGSKGLVDSGSLCEQRDSTKQGETSIPNCDGRFAPSPTGPLHLGNLRTALLAWLFARSAGARFLVRVEDLDRSRVRPGMEEAQLSDLRAIGLDWDGPVVRQSERMELYEEAIARLEADGLLYPCYCTRAEIRAAASAPHGISAADRYPGTCRELTAAQRAEREAAGRPPALRVRSEDVRMAFEDRLLGTLRRSGRRLRRAPQRRHARLTSSPSWSTMPRRG